MKLAQFSSLQARLQGIDPALRSGHIERGRLVKYLRARKERNDSCFSLPFTFLFYFLFCTLVFAHFQQQTIYKLISAVEQDLPLAAMESSYPTELWSWLKTRSGSSRTARFNHVIGGILVETLTEMPRQFSHELETLCSYSAWDFLGSPSRDTPEMCRSEASRAGDTRKFWVPWYIDQGDLESVVAEVQKWWANSTSTATFSSSSYANGGLFAIDGPSIVQVSFLAENPSVDYYVLARIVFHTLDSGSLEVTKDIQAFDSLPVWTDSSSEFSSNTYRSWLIVGDVAFIAMLFILLLSRLWLLSLDISRKKVLRGIKAYCTVWELIDWVIIAMGFFLCFFYPYRVELTRGLGQLQVGMPSVDESTTMSQSDFESLLATNTTLSMTSYQLRLEAILEQADLVALATADGRWYSAVFACAMCFRFFKAFRANPRLNIVTSTVRRAFSDFIHFVIVFIFVFAGFVVVAHILFGPNVEEFSTLGTSIQTSFLMLMGFLYDDLRETMHGVGGGGTLAIFWTGAFHVFIVMLLLDMILAILLDVYSQEKAAIGDSPSLMQQAMDLVREYKADRVMYKQVFERRSSTQASTEPLTKQATGQLSRGTTASTRPDAVAFSDGPRADSMLVETGAIGPDDEGAAVVKRRKKHWNEGSLLAALERRGGEFGGGGEWQLMTSDMVGAEIQALSIEELSQVELLLHRAMEESTKANKQLLSISDSLLLSSRADATAREVAPVARSLALAVQRREAERQQLERALTIVAKAASVVPKEVRRPVAIQVSEGAPQEQGAPQEPSREDPDPEPASGQGATNVVAEEELVAAVARQAKLEEMISRLAESVSPILEAEATWQQGREEEAARMQQQQQLEAQIDILAASLAPLLEIGSLAVPAKFTEAKGTAGSNFLENPTAVQELEDHANEVAASSSRVASHIASDKLRPESRPRGVEVQPERSVLYTDSEGDVIQFLLDNPDGHLDYYVNRQLKVTSVTSVVAEGTTITLEGTPAGPWGGRRRTVVPEERGASAILQLFQTSQQAQLAPIAPERAPSISPPPASDTPKRPSQQGSSRPPVAPRFGQGHPSAAAAAASPVRHGWEAVPTTTSIWSTVAWAEEGQRGGRIRNGQDLPRRPDTPGQDAELVAPPAPKGDSVG